VQLVTPPALTAGTPAQLVFRLNDATTGAPLTDLVESHEKLIHLILVSSDLIQFQHVHPQPTGTPGEYAVDVVFPTEGSYTLYSEFTRANNHDILAQQRVSVGTAGSNPARLVEDGTPKVSNGVRVQLDGADGLQAGTPAELTFKLEDAQTGVGLQTLQPYLGAPAHIVIIDQQNASFAHTHGEQVGAESGTHQSSGSEQAMAGTMYGPDIAFHYTFPAPGLYKVWGQFQTQDGQVLTAAYVVRVQ